MVGSSKIGEDRPVGRARLVLPSDEFMVLIIYSLILLTMVNLYDFSSPFPSLRHRLRNRLLRARTYDVFSFATAPLLLF